MMQIITIETLPGIGKLSSSNEVVICRVLTINHIWLNDADKITCTAMLPAITD